MSCPFRTAIQLPSSSLTQGFNHQQVQFISCARSSFSIHPRLSLLSVYGIVWRHQSSQHLLHLIPSPAKVVRSSWIHRRHLPRARRRPTAARVPCSGALPLTLWFAPRNALACQRSRRASPALLPPLLQARRQAPRRPRSRNKHQQRRRPTIAQPPSHRHKAHQHPTLPPPLSRSRRLRPRLHLHLRPRRRPRRRRRRRRRRPRRAAWNSR